MSRTGRTTQERGAERAEPGLAGGARAAPLKSPEGSPSTRRYTPEDRRALLAAYSASGQTMERFCAEQGVSTARSTTPC